MISLYLTIPKFIVLRNTRLVLFSMFVRLAMISLLAASFFRSRQFADEVSIGKGMDVSMWVTHYASPEDLEKVWADATRSPLCRTPEIYDYWWDETYKYETQGCSKLCSQGNSSVAEATCIDDGLYLRENQDQLFFITRRELSTRSNSATSSATFFPQVLAMGLAMSFNYKVEVPLFEFPWFFGQRKHEHVGSSRRNVFTVVLDAQGRLNKTMKPETGIEFTLPDLLWLSGSIDFLDAPDTTKSTNKKIGATFQHPSGRVSGGMITIRIHCSNTLECPNCEDETNELDNAWSSGAYDTMCTLKIVLGYDQWAYHETMTEDLEGNAMLLSRQGLRVTCQRDGAFEFWEGKRIGVVLSSWIVWVEVAKFVALMFIVRCLGLISSIYRRAIYDTFDIRETVAGMAARLMVASVTFDLLQDRQKQGITEGCAKTQIKRVFDQRHSQIDEREKNMFAAFCWEAQVLPETLDRHTPEAPLWGSASYLNLDQVAASTGFLDIDTFSIAFSNFERLKFDSLVELFDRDRNKGLLERLFTPEHLSNALKRAHLVCRHGKDLRLSPAASTSGRIRRDSRGDLAEPDEVVLQSEAPRFPARNKTLGEEAMWKAEEALAEVAGLRKSVDARIQLLETDSGRQNESRLTDLERMVDRLATKQDQMWTMLGMTGSPHDNLFSDMQSRLCRLEQVDARQRFEQLEERLKDFEVKSNENIQKRIRSLEEFAKRVGQYQQKWLDRDDPIAVETREGYATSASDQHGNLFELQEWVVKKIAYCMDDVRASCEALEEQIQHVAAAVAKVERDMFTADSIDEYLTRHFGGLLFDSSCGIKFSGNTVAHEHSTQEKHAPVRAKGSASQPPVYL